MTAMQRPWHLANANGLVLGLGIFNWHCLSSPPQIPRGPRAVLERGGLVSLVHPNGISTV
jgi:hypothetical protein